jgi:hypothetical protein
VNQLTVREVQWGLAVVAAAAASEDDEAADAAAYAAAATRAKANASALAFLDRLIRVTEAGPGSG